jgi:hypothetical protein
VDKEYGVVTDNKFKKLLDKNENLDFRKLQDIYEILN